MFQTCSGTFQTPGGGLCSGHLVGAGRVPELFSEHYPPRVPAGRAFRLSYGVNPKKTVCVNVPDVFRNVPNTWGGGTCSGKRYPSPVFRERLGGMRHGCACPTTISRHGLARAVYPCGRYRTEPKLSRGGKSLIEASTVSSCHLCPDSFL